MRPRSELLQDILSKVVDERGIINGRVSQEVFLYTTYEVIYQKDLLQKFKDGTISQAYVEELRQTQKLLYDYLIKDAWGQLRDFVNTVKGDDNLASVLMFNGIMANADIGEVFGEYKHGEVLTVLELVQAIFKSPTQQVKKLLRDEPLKAPQQQTDTDESQDEQSQSNDNADTDTQEDDTLSTEADSSYDNDVLERFLAYQRRSQAVDSTKDATQKLNDIVKRTDELYRYLSFTVFGQEHAVATFVSGYFQAELVMLMQKDRRQPRATFLFAGPPGVGKTFLSEQCAKMLKLPFKRFDMSEYADKEAVLEFAGSDKVYKNGKEGNVTSYVSEHPKSILLFDEIEKAHLSVIYLFLQILDAGRLRDNFTDEEISFKDTIIIFTTNVGKRMYDDHSINLTEVSAKSVLKALSSEINPVTKEPAFPMAMCSRFASGNVVMFNRIGVDDQLKIVNSELQKQADTIHNGTGIDIEIKSDVVRALMFAQGGRSDARTVKGKSVSYFFNELYELLRLIGGSQSNHSIDKLRSITYDVQLPDAQEVATLFHSVKPCDIFIFADKKVVDNCKKTLKGMRVFSATTFEQAQSIMERQQMLLVLCDITYKPKRNKKVLSIEDIQSQGRDFFHYANKYYDVPVYVLATNDTKISKEETLSLIKSGAKDIVPYNDDMETLNQSITTIVDNENCERNLVELAKCNKVLSFKTMQSVSRDGKQANITMYDFVLSTAIDAEDNEGVLNDVSKPDVCFDDVIGAKDAKEELNYVINYMKNPSKYIAHGVKPPKGILLYGPPGTGKTLLAKAVAGESGLTFIKAEGNQFLRKFVGEGVEAVHEIFAKARKYAPSILFIDEVEVIAKQRGISQQDNGRDDVITAFLTEMDGFNTDTTRPVFVLCATNFTVEQGNPNSLDSALLRRFDRRIFVDLPDKEERLDFINRKVNKLVEHSLSTEQLENLAIRSTGLSLADIDSIFELALRDVIKTDGYCMTDSVLEEAFESFVNGEEKQYDSNELLRTARHEAGHTVMSYLSGNTPSYVTIVARGSHGGYMQQGDGEKKGLYTKKELLSQVNTALAGRVAEMLYYGTEDGISTGASGDIRSATAIVKAMICEYGMDDLFGCVHIDDANDNQYYSKVMDRVNQIIDAQLQYTIKVLGENMHLLDKLSQRLMDKTALKQREIVEILSAKE